MVSRVTRRSVCWCLVALTFVTVSADDLEQYREFRLGTTVASVSSATGSTASDLKTLHARPALLQDLAWRPRYAVRRPIPDTDPVREMVFSFYDDQLYRIAVEYDPSRTAGLTPDDMIASLAAVYGTPTDVAAPRPARAPFASTSVTSVPLAQWQRGDTTLALHWSEYRAAFGLLVTSTRLEGQARTAAADAIALDALEAPARDAARAKQRADAEQATADNARAANKGAFRP